MPRKRIPSFVLAVTITMLGFLLVGCPGEAPSRESEAVTLVSWGGQFQQDLVDLWLEPAAENCKINVVTQTWNGDYGALSSQIEKDINIWDIVHVEGHYVASPRADSLFQSFPDRDPGLINPSLIRSNAVPVLEYGYVMAYREDLIPHSEPMTSWADFWDESRWPGRRGLRDFPIGNIEIALLSLGSDPRQTLYSDSLSRAQVSSEVDRALRRINELSDVEWWTSGDQLQRLITTGATPIVAAWSGRLWAAHKELCSANSLEDCVLKTVSKDVLTGTDWWIIPANSKNGWQANRLLECLLAEENTQRAVEFAKKQGYTVPVRDLEIADPVGHFYLDLGITKETRLHLNEEFWGEHFEWINRAWIDNQI